MKLRVIYRAVPGSNPKRRPGWFSKWLCLGSFLKAAEQVDSADLRIEFLCDGALAPPVEAAMSRFGHVEVLDRLGNSGSYLYAVRSATDPRVSNDDAIYLVEDDYLHLPTSLTCLQGALAEGPRHSYYTLYDHPDRYTRTDDLNPGGTALQVIGDHHWRGVESTNMTFATRVATLRRDRAVHWLSSRFTSYPHDRALWRTLQGLGVRRPVRWVRGRRPLLGAVPALATHAEERTLAPTVDWADLADCTRSWMFKNGLTADVSW